jgi:hypothetical protein
MQLAKSPQTQIAVLAVISIGGLLIGNAVVALFALMLLGSMAALPNRSPLLYWPLGLLAVIVLNFFGYVFLWSQSASGVDATDGVVTLGSVTIFLALVALSRSRRNRPEETKQHQVKPRLVMLLTIQSVLIILLATIRFYWNPVPLISGFMAGGDHNMHVEITHRLMEWSGWRIEQVPISLFGYPKGIHFLIAELTAIESKSSSENHLTQQFLMSAWFEWLQLAAAMQCGVLIVVGNLRKVRLSRVFLAMLITSFICLVDNLVAQLFWSGFTTTLGITWVLLLGVALPWEEISIHKSAQVPLTVTYLGFFTIASLIIYQPYALIFVSLLVLYLFAHTDLKRLRFLDFFKSNRFKLNFPILIFLILSTLLLFPFLLAGVRGHAIDSLLAKGQLLASNFHLVLFCFVASFAMVSMKIVRLRADKSSAPMSIADGLITSIWALSLSIVLIVMRASDFGLRNQPYYSQKLMWIGVIVSLPFICSQLLDLFEKFAVSLPKVFLMVPFVITALVGFSFGLEAATPTRHGSVDWMARGMLVDVEIPNPRSLAVSPGDALGTHLANLAIRTRTQVNIPVELALSGDIAAICDYANENQVLLIYTGVSESDQLKKLGCNKDIIYVENGLVKK